MSLAFLYPLCWIGALAIAAPIWLHLRRKFDANVLDFPALRFLDDQPEPRLSPLRPRDLLLLALRVLGVLLLVSAFAWPYWREPEKEIIEESRVYLFDNTMSHRAHRGFVQDRDRLLADLARTGKELQIAVIELTAQPRVVVGFGDDRRAAERAIRALEPSSQRGSYLAAFRLAHSLLIHSLGRERRIVVLGDNQENQWAENAGAPPFLEGVKVDLPEVRETSAPNLWLSGPRARRILLGDKAVVDLAVDLSRRGDAAKATVVLRSDGEEILRREVELDSEAATTTLAARWETDPSRWLRGEASVEGRPDALDGDNRVFFTLPPVREGSVLLLARSPYLRTALSPEVMRGRWACRVVEPARIDEAEAGPDPDVLCVEADYLRSAKARDLVLRHLSRGGGVLLLVDRGSLQVKGFLRDLGLELQGGESPKGTSFRYVFADHPIFRPFASPDFGNLMEVRVYRHRRLRAARAMPLAFSQEGDPLVLQAAAAKGKLFVCAFGFERGETNWPLHPTFVPFLDLCLQNARAEDPMPTAFEPGELAVLNLPASSPAREAIARDGERERARAPVQGGRAQVAMPDAPGLYTMAFDGDPSQERLLSVNPSPLESELTYTATPAALAAWQIRSGSRPAQPRPAVAPAEASLASLWRRRTWWWLLLAGLAALVGETAWVSLRKERS